MNGYYYIYLEQALMLIQAFMIQNPDVYLKSLQIMYVVYEIVLLVTTIMMKLLWIMIQQKAMFEILRTVYRPGICPKSENFMEMHVSEEKGTLYEKCLNQAFNMLNFVHLI